VCSSDLRTGGALSEIIGKIAEDVSFELRMRIRDFVEKLNVIGLFFMMVAIVLPVFIAIIAGIGASQPALPLSFVDTPILIMIYGVSTALLGLILYIIRAIQP
jgi:flagellar protein FlaJ